MDTYLICCCSNDSNRKSEKYSKATCYQYAPPWQLELIIVILASKYGCPNVYEKDAHEPPLRDLLVFSHELCVDIHLVLLECRLA